MARAPRESLHETGIFPIPWFTPHLAKNHEGLENAEPLAVENAKLMSSAAHRNYPRQFGGGISRILHVLRRKQRVEDFRYVALARISSECTACN